MKKIVFTLLLAGGLLTSCDMDKKPYGSLDDTTAIETLNDCARFRNGLYSSMRGMTSGGRVIYPEIQMDMFQGLMSNGNRIGTFSNGNVLSSDQDIESLWAGSYSVINSANYIIEKMEGLQENKEWDEDDLVTLRRYDAEARFVRAYCYYWLVDHFCDTYSSANATAEAKGVPIVTVYNPTADRSKYPGRSTQDEAYTLIAEDLDAAYTGLKAYEQAVASAAPAPNSAYINSNTVLALQARIALLKGDYKTAISKAESVINSGTYALTSIADYENLWVNDEGNEVIFRPFMSNTELGNSFSSTTFMTDNDESADYIPCYNILDLYGEGDIRFDTFFGVNYSLKVNGASIPAYIFTKYPGNETLKTGTARNFYNMAKPFRLSELYLIVAEAAAADGQATVANTYLNDLRRERIEGYEDVNLSGSTLTQAIRDERLKELIGEGFRLSDLRRWKQGFTRDSSYPANPSVADYFISPGKTLSYDSSDYRYVWPIPSVEIQTNPQLDGQQNPGY
jgi:hypothetical protein